MDIGQNFELCFHYFRLFLSLLAPYSHSSKIALGSSKGNFISCLVYFSRNNLNPDHLNQEI